MAKSRAPRRRLTQEQWQVALADEMRATMARKRVLQKDIMGVLGVHDPSYVSRRMNGVMPLTAPELVVLCDFLDEDISSVMSRAKDNATNPCLSHSATGDAPRKPSHLQPAPPPAANRVSPTPVSALSRTIPLPSQLLSEGA